MENMCGIYTITNKVNGKIYVGSSVNIQKRWNVHKHLLAKNKHDNIYLQRAYNKQNVSDFEFKIFEVGIPISDLLSWEQAVIDFLKPNYNLAPIAGTVLGTKRTTEQLNKMSEVAKGSKNGHYGKKHTDEAKAKMAAKAKLRKLSEETKSKIKNSMVGSKNHFYGKVHTEESKRKISISKGKK